MGVGALCFSLAAALALLAERSPGLVGKVVSGSATRARSLRAALPADELERFFFDRAELFVRSGAGGKGAVAFRSRQPAGGNGGAGGSVFLVCDSSLNTLGHLRGRMSVRAEPGADANGRESGRAAAEVLVRVPPNCRVSDMETGVHVGELMEPGDRLLVASGGQGGEGNGEVFRRTRTDSQKVTPPGGTERRKLLLSMTLVADVGLIGFPNAGKSTLISAVTRARPKVRCGGATGLQRPRRASARVSPFHLDHFNRWQTIHLPHSCPTSVCASLTGQAEARC